MLPTNRASPRPMPEGATPPSDPVPPGVVLAYSCTAVWHRRASRILARGVGRVDRRVRVTLLGRRRGAANDGCRASACSVRFTRFGRSSRSLNGALALISVACANDLCHSVSLVTLRLCHLVTCCYSAIVLRACVLVCAALILVLSSLARPARPIAQQCRVVKGRVLLSRWQTQYATGPLVSGRS